MNNLIEIMANIELFVGEKMRTAPFVSGYRPVFEFINARTRTSGRIDLINMELFYPGDFGIVQVTFNKGIISNSHFKVGKVFTFSEGVHPLGKGEITDILNL